MHCAILLKSGVPENYVSTEAASWSKSEPEIEMSRQRPPIYRAALKAGQSSQNKAVCLSVYQTRGLWQNRRTFCPDFYTVRKII